MGDEAEVDRLLTLILLTAADSSAEHLGKALHRAVNQDQAIIAAFNREVEREFDDELARRGLRRTSLRRLATKNGFGVN